MGLTSGVKFVLGVTILVASSELGLGYNKKELKTLFPF
jgi:hypothetical protein